MIKVFQGNLVDLKLIEQYEIFEQNTIHDSKRKDKQIKYMLVDFSILKRHIENLSNEFAARVQTQKVIVILLSNF